MPLPTMRKGNVHILYPRGTFDRKMSAELETKIYELNDKKVVNILLNLKRVKGILSHGVHTLVEMYERCREKGGTVKLCGLKRDVRFVLEFTKLNDVFEIYEEEEEAWKSFQSKPGGTAPPPGESPLGPRGQGGIRPKMPKKNPPRR